MLGIYPYIRSLLKCLLISFILYPFTVLTLYAKGGHIPAVKVPILVYHIVRPSYPDDSLSVRALAVTPEIFDQEMSVLKSRGYVVIPFSELEDHFYKGTVLPQKPVVLTFDDGWKDQYEYALPILEKYNYTATFFIPSNFPGHPSYMSWSGLKDLIRNGMTIGSHSKSHPYLTHITSSSTLWKEISISKDTLEKKTGEPVLEFSYPFGAFSTTTIEMVKKAGYKSARADYFSLANSSSTLYNLGSLNAPTLTKEFEKYFP